jgi:hypothetical protein
MTEVGGGAAPVATRLPRGIFAKLKGGARVNLNGVLHGHD